MYPINTGHGHNPPLVPICQILIVAVLVHVNAHKMICAVFYRIIIFVVIIIDLVHRPSLKSPHHFTSSHSFAHLLRAPLSILTCSPRFDQQTQILYTVLECILPNTLRMCDRVSFRSTFTFYIQK